MEQIKMNLIDMRMPLTNVSGGTNFAENIVIPEEGVIKITFSATSEIQKLEINIKRGGQTIVGKLNKTALQPYVDYTFAHSVLKDDVISLSISDNTKLLNYCMTLAKPMDIPPKNSSI